MFTEDQNVPELLSSESQIKYSPHDMSLNLVYVSGACNI